MRGCCCRILGRAREEVAIILRSMAGLGETQLSGCWVEQRLRAETSCGRLPFNVELADFCFEAGIDFLKMQLDLAPAWLAQ